MTTIWVYPKKYKQYLLLIFAVFAGCNLSKTAWAEEVNVQVTGTGLSNAEAISSALVLAVEQVSGVKIESNSSLIVEMRSISNGKDDSVLLNENQQKEISKNVNGIIKRYDIIQSGQENDNRYVVNLNVVIERYAPPGLPTQDRRRIYTVLPIDQSNKARENAPLLMEKINSYLVQSRRFAVLDRGNIGTYDKEIAILKGDNVPLSETVRIGQVIGSDYIVIPKIRKFEQVESRQTIQTTGQTVVRRTTLLNVDYVLVDVATRQIRWTGTINKQEQSSPEASILAAAEELGESILNSIYPLRVVQVTDSGTVVINQGGDTLKVGQLLSVQELGDAITDPYTKEPLGRVETPVAQIRIERIDPKLSYGRVTGGKVNTESDYILLKAESPAPQSTSASSPLPKQDKMKW